MRFDSNINSRLLFLQLKVFNAHWLAWGWGISETWSLHFSPACQHVQSHQVILCLNVNLKIVHFVFYCCARFGPFDTSYTLRQEVEETEG